MQLRTLLIANRGEVAVRLTRTAKRLGIKTVAIYTDADSTSLHIRDADEAIRLEGPDASAYLDGTQIIEIAKSKKVDAIVPGYGFLSENADFAKQVRQSGIVYVGPPSQIIEDFGNKHTARQLAKLANVPIVPGSEGLILSETQAVEEARSLGFPVMLKPVAGGGGIGIKICHSEQEVRSACATVRSRADALFKNDGLFMEKYYPKAHHIEIQIFGNGTGKAIHFGERECSIQRRYQKIIEECPSPFVERRPELRQRMCAAAVRIAEMIGYGSVGTIEYLVDDETADFFFLEMNTRLQVEHGITELVYGVDLVELMFRQADAELQGKGGLGDAELDHLNSSSTPHGHAVEARVYAENPARSFAPCPGILQDVSWSTTKGVRVDTWVHTGTQITTNYDSLLAKVMVHGDSRQSSVRTLQHALRGSNVFGPPNNIDFLASVLAAETFSKGHTLTSFLETFQYHHHAIDVISGGAYTLVEDWPGRPTLGRGFGHCGPTDATALRIANLLVGNKEGEAGLEITLHGPSLRFLGAAVVALCGAEVATHLDGQPLEMWKSVFIEAGQQLTIGRTVGKGCRAYLAIKGGLPDVASWYGSKATAPMTAVGGYQGRALAAGDLLALSKIDLSRGERSLPPAQIPEYPDEWELRCMPGPYAEGFLSDDFIEEFYSTTFEISHNANRGGIRLIGPRPRFARVDGGEGGSHPSNVIEYGYSVGGVNWTGDDPCLFPVDGPDFGGFISSTTVIKADWWQMGQMKAGDKVRFRQVSYREAVDARKAMEAGIQQLASNEHGEAVRDSRSISTPFSMADAEQQGFEVQKAVFFELEETRAMPHVLYRQSGDDFLIVEYGQGSFDMNYRCRAVCLYQKLQKGKGQISFAGGSLLVGMPCGNSLTIHYDSLKVDRSVLLKHLVSLEHEMQDLGRSQFRGRKFRLPITFGSQVEKDSIRRYMDTKRPYASYLPDPMDFVAKNNGISKQQLREIFTESSFMILAVGFFVALPIALPIDPRRRIVCPKMNPSRIHTPAGQVGWGGSCMALYNVESPGGYMNTGLSIPGVDIFGFKHGFSRERPWLFGDFDQITFYEVTEEKYREAMRAFESGQYRYEYEEVVFDLEEHNKLLAETAEEVKGIRQKQKAARAEMERLESELLERWTKEKEAVQVSQSVLDILLKDPSIVSVEAPSGANVWKIEVEEGDKIKRDHILLILEAMKLEIAVPAQDNMAGASVEKILVKAGNVVQPGMPLLLLRKS